MQSRGAKMRNPIRVATTTDDTLRRLFDILFAGASLLLTAPVLLASLVALYLQDFRSPLYLGRRIGLNGRPFTLLKFRSMVIDAHKVPIDTTSANDPRITPLGRIMRRFKVDEFPQFLNVLVGDMGIVGPRPQVPRETALYTEAEKRLLSVRPGITDLASIVFSDLDRIVASEPDPDIAYNQLVRPWKSRIGLFYIDNRSLVLDVSIIALTVLNFVSRRQTLRLLAALMRRLGASSELVAVAERRHKLQPAPPPGSDKIVESRTPNPGRPD